MNVILEFAPDFIYIRYVSTEPGLHVDGGVPVYPGERYGQFTYEELHAMGPGRKNLKRKDAKNGKSDS